MACSERLGVAHVGVGVPWKRKWWWVESKKKPQGTSMALVPGEAWTQCSCLHPHWNL